MSRNKREGLYGGRFCGVHLRTRQFYFSLKGMNIYLDPGYHSDYDDWED